MCGRQPRTGRSTSVRHVCAVCVRAAVVPCVGTHVCNKESTGVPVQWQPLSNVQPITKNTVCCQPYKRAVRGKVKAATHSAFTFSSGSGEPRAVTVGKPGGNPVVGCNAGRITHACGVCVSKPWCVGSKSSVRGIASHRSQRAAVHQRPVEMGMRRLGVGGW